MPLTFGEAAGWYRNIVAAGGASSPGAALTTQWPAPVIVDRATALPAFPRYERLALRAIGINEFVWLHDEPSSPKALTRISQSGSASAKGRTLIAVFDGQVSRRVRSSRAWWGRRAL